ncbi:hypothetical protein PTKIN_Ptkin07bG0101200 [Pterospermum kingtungense]
MQVWKPVDKQSKPLAPINVAAVKGGSTNRFAILAKEIIAAGDVIGEVKAGTVNTGGILEGDFSVNIFDNILVSIADTVHTSVDTVDAIGTNINAKNTVDTVNVDKNSVGIADADMIGDTNKIVDNVDTVDAIGTNINAKNTMDTVNVDKISVGITDADMIGDTNKTVDNVDTVDTTTIAINVVHKGDEALKVVNAIKDVDTMAK